jgi:hypothetical protein
MYINCNLSPLKLSPPLSPYLQHLYSINTFSPASLHLSTTLSSNISGISPSSGLSSSSSFSGLSSFHSFLLHHLSSILCLPSAPLLHSLSSSGTSSSPLSLPQGPLLHSPSFQNLYSTLFSSNISSSSTLSSFRTYLQCIILQYSAPHLFNVFFPAHNPVPPLCLSPLLSSLCSYLPPPPIPSSPPSLPFLLTGQNQSLCSGSCPVQV